VSAPLSDVRVLDLTRLLPGGFCSLLLADLGAEVLKVEDTGIGDYIRWAPPYYGGEEARKLGTASSLYLSLNRGKRSVRLDLKSEAGREAFLRLVSSYDVVLDGFRPGVLERLGVGYERMREANPGIVVCAITGYGQDGPNAERAGHDIDYLALTGLLGLSGTHDGPPVSSAGQIADVNGGLMAAIGVLAALNERRRSGEGQMVDISMADGALSWLALVVGRYLCDREVPRRGEGQLSGGILCYLPYEAADGWVACGALEPKFWAAFCEGVGRPDLIEVQFEAPGSPGWRQVAEIFRGRTREEWRAFNDANDCCIEPILDMDEALESELVRAREMVVEIDQPGIGSVGQLGLPVKLGRTPGDPTRPAPAFGEHTAEVLREAGYSDEDVREMLSSGAAAGPERAGAQAEFRA
jgi:alpha-methylacyl-CoA racemase